MKNVLFITYDFPFPTTSGGKNRAYHMLKYSDGNFKKYLYSFIRPDFKSSYKDELAKIDVEVVRTLRRKPVKSISNIAGLATSSIFKTLYFSPKILSDIVSIINEKKIDIVHFESYYTGFFISAKIRQMGVKQVFGTEYVEYKLYADFVKKSPVLLRPLYKFQLDKIKNEEINMFKAADLCVAVSEKDAEEVGRYAKCEIVRNGVDVSDLSYKAPKREAKNLLFVGNFMYFPNTDAINYFYNDVFKNLDLDMNLTIIGKQAGSLSCATDPRVKTIEFIPEIADAYAAADIMVAPIRLGGGTNFKILEAMAAGVPTISLPQRLEGLGVVDGRELLVAGNAEEFKSKIKELAEDYELRKKISENARRLVEREYSWDVIGKKLAKIWESV